jgi:hypothetical protein
MSKPTRADSCERRVDHHLEGRLEDLRRLWTAYRNGEDENAEDGSFSEYGLCFGYVPPLTFNDQTEAFFRYQLSSGGPGDEFRFFVNPDLSCHRIEYWFLDWFDGAHRVLAGEERALLSEIWNWFRETGSASDAFRAAQDSC